MYTLSLRQCVTNIVAKFVVRTVLAVAAVQPLVVLYSCSRCGSRVFFQRPVTAVFSNNDGLCLGI